MSLRRLLCTSRKVPPPVVAARSTLDLAPVNPTGSDLDPHDDKCDPITPIDDPELYIYYKSYNSARDKCLNDTFYKGGTTEPDV
ncbi:hypothetical protein AXX17_AT3G29440 [Arabidopsis thaliana]|uniref:Uncharacterized protein n=1 Tax=Arabidopsis thaliana TaxID=3702 RepID=A0A178VLT9_ARATH|nr:hypothetical protein AXX17_AT3G29440 [Arabidopsis thaliana]